MLNISNKNNGVHCATRSLGLSRGRVLRGWRERLQGMSPSRMHQRDPRLQYRVRSGDFFYAGDGEAVLKPVKCGGYVAPVFDAASAYLDFVMDTAASLHSSATSFKGEKKRNEDGEYWWSRVA